MAKIHPAYVIFFTYIDPAISFLTVIVTLISPDLMVEAGIDLAVAPRNPDHDFLLYQCAMLYGLTGSLSAFLLRYTRDLGVWNILESAILCVDISIVVSLVVTLDHQGRLWDLALWRPMDWNNMVLVLVVIVLRSAFLAGVGVAAEAAPLKANGKRA
jgi:hypothetical protein